MAEDLKEVEFSRSIWSAANQGDVGRVRKLLKDPDIQDSCGYTALVSESSVSHALCTYISTMQHVAGTRTSSGC